MREFKGKSVKKRDFFLDMLHISASTSDPPLSFMLPCKSVFVLIIHKLKHCLQTVLVQVQCTSNKLTKTSLPLSLFSFTACRLHFVFHQPLLHALDLVDQKNVTKLITPSGRVLYQVTC